MLEMCLKRMEITVIFYAKKLTSWFDYPTVTDHFPSVDLFQQSPYLSKYRTAAPSAMTLVLSTGC